MRMLASVYANHDSQPSNPNQVMVIMFGVELSAVDKAHRYLKSFVERRGRLQFRRGLQECLNEARPPRLELLESFSHGSLLMPLRQLLKARSNGWSVRLPSVLQILESLLPELLDIREMADVLSNRPLLIELKSCAGVVHSDEQCVNSRQRATKALDKVRKHP